MAPGRVGAFLRFGLFVLLYLFLFFGAAWVLLLLTEPFQLSVIMRGLIASAVGGLAAVFTATFFLVSRVDERTMAFVGLGREPGWGREFGVGFVIGAAMISAIVLLKVVTGHAVLQPTPAPAGAILLQTLLFFLIFLGGSFHEEMLFRGYPFQRLIEVVGVPAAVLLLAAAFGVLHYWNPYAGWVGTVNTMLVGILFAVAYLRTGGLWLPIGLHWSWNFFEAAWGFPVSGIRIDQMPLTAGVRGRELFHGGDYGPEASIFATIVIAAVTLLILLAGHRLRSRKPPAATGSL
jgi:uncharacterized protein